MDEIVKTVAAKTGVGEETVRQVLTQAAEFVKAKLPPQFAGQVDSFLGGQGGPAGGAWG